MAPIALHKVYGIYQLLIEIFVMVFEFCNYHFIHCNGNENDSKLHFQLQNGNDHEI